MSSHIDPLANLVTALMAGVRLTSEEAFALIDAYEREVRRDADEHPCKHDTSTLNAAGVLHCDRCGARVEPGAPS